MNISRNSSKFNRLQGGKQPKLTEH